MASHELSYAILEFQKADRLLAKVVLVVLVEIFEILSKEKNQSLVDYEAQTSASVYEQSSC